jgi:diguanylate cyclase (GGDEF)-like protein
VPQPARVAAPRAVRSGLTGTPGALVVTLALAAVSVALLPSALAHTGTTSGPSLPWWVLALMFGAVEMCVLHVQVRREAQTVSLSEIPLVLGLFLASPLALLAGRVLGPFLVFVVHRRQSPVKLAYNTALLTANVSVALTVFSLLGGDDDVTDLRSWFACYAAVAAAGALDAVATTLAIAAYERRLDARSLLREPAVEVPRAVAVATLALVAVFALTLDTRATVPLLASCAIVMAAYRAYASLSDRHLSLERLYRFSQAVSSRPEIDEVLGSVLAEARELLHAEHAEVLFLSPGAAVRLALDSSDRLLRHDVADPVPAGSISAQVVHASRAALLCRGTKDAAGRAHLEQSGLREAVVAPLRGDAGVIGTLTVADRLGQVRTFVHADLQLLETVANHASIALQNGRLIEQLRHDALHDALTGLPNRVQVQRRLGEALHALDRGESPGVAVMVMDLDRFKEVNDTLGHSQGDALLVEVAQRLRAAAGADCVVARLGGDEFAVLVPAIADMDLAVRRGRRLVQALEQPIDLSGFEVGVGGSLGIAWAPEHGDDVSGLLKRADVAMYAAKGSTAAVRLYDPEIDTTSPQRLALVGELRTAIEQDQLEVYVQPKALLATGEVVSVEALVRWAHPVHGFLPPDEFIPVAERSGLIGPLTHAVLRSSLRAAAGWRAAGREIGVAVNLSARSLVDLDLADDVASLLRRYAFPPSLLTLELTEGSVMTDPARTMSVLLALRQMGVRLSVDDFGTGYSSLSYLKRLPVHEVKIDKSFVTHLVTDADDATIVRSIIDLAANLSLEVVAEGVEDQAAWDRLAELGCRFAQGWHLGRPMPIADLLRWLADHDAARAARLVPPAATPQVPGPRAPVRLGR